MSIIIDELISVVFKRRPLWDQSDPRHHNRYVLDKLWDEVAAKMNCKRNEVRRKWKNLRDKFRIEVQKSLKPCPVDLGNNDMDSTWQHYQSLLFLKDQFTPRQSTANVNIIPEIVYEDVYQEAECHDIDAESTTSQQSGDSTYPTSTPSTNYAKRKVSQQSAGKRSHDEIESSLLEQEQQKFHILENGRPDEDQSFFDSLLPHVRKLNDNKKMLLRLEIQQLVYQHVYLQQKETHQ